MSIQDYLKKSIVWTLSPKFKNQFIAENDPELRVRINDFFEDEHPYTLIIKDVHVDFNDWPPSWIGPREIAEKAFREYLKAEIAWKRCHQPDKCYIHSKLPDVKLRFDNSKNGEQKITLEVCGIFFSLNELPLGWVFFDDFQEERSM